jgi:hypothetical protein
VNGSEFQEVYRYIATLEKRIKVLEKQVESMPKVLDLTEEQADALAEIAYESEDSK